MIGDSFISKCNNTHRKSVWKFVMLANDKGMYQHLLTNWPEKCAIIGCLLSHRIERRFKWKLCLSTTWINWIFGIPNDASNEIPEHNDNVLVFENEYEHLIKKEMKKITNRLRRDCVFEVKYADCVFAFPLTSSDAFEINSKYTSHKR